MAALALTTDTSMLTSVANDYGFEQVFARQVEALGQAGDVAVGDLDQRRSPNVIDRVQVARRAGCRPWRSPGATAARSARWRDPHQRAGRDDRRVQEVHRTLLHAICEIVEAGLTGYTMPELQTSPELRSETMTVNMGPQHPSTHGVLRLVLELRARRSSSADTTIGYLHTGIEKTAEQKKWQQVIPLVERMDYLGRAVQLPGLLPVGRAAARRRGCRSA